MNKGYWVKSKQFVNLSTPSFYKEMQLINYQDLTQNTIQYNTIQYNTIQYNTIQYNTIQYNTIQYNTTQYNAMQCIQCIQYIQCIILLQGRIGKEIWSVFLVLQQGILLGFLHSRTEYLRRWWHIPILSRLTPRVGMYPRFKWTYYKDILHRDTTSKF